MTESKSISNRFPDPPSGGTSLRNDRYPTTTVTVKASSTQPMRIDEGDQTARNSHLNEVSLLEAGYLQNSRGSCFNPKTMAPLTHHSTPSKSSQNTGKEREYNQAILGIERHSSGGEGPHNNGSNTIFASNSKRLNSSDREQQFKMAQASPSQHPSLLLKSNDNNNDVVPSTQVYKQQQQQKVMQQNNARLFPDRQLSHNLKEELTPPQVKVSPRKQTVMGLGLGMGIEMGSDGRFYASMGGKNLVTKPSAEGQEFENSTPTSGIFQRDNRLKFLEASNSNNNNNTNYQGQMRTGNEVQKRISNNTQVRNTVSNNKRNAYMQQQCQSPTQGSNLIRVNLNEYQEIFNSVQDRQRITLQKHIRQPFSQGSKDEARNSNYKLRSPVGSFERRSTNFNLALTGTAEDVKVSVGSQLSRRDVGAPKTKPTQLPPYNNLNQNMRGNGPHSTQRMNQSRESYFTEQQTLNGVNNIEISALSQFQQTQFRNQATIPPVGAQVSLEQLQKTQQTQPSGKQNLDQPGETRPFILMKNKGEEGSKQLKHGVAQQIIAATSKTSATTSNLTTGKTSYGSQTRKSSLLAGPQMSESDAKQLIGMPTNDEITRDQNTYDLNNLYVQLTSDAANTNRHNFKQLQSRSVVQNQPMSQLDKSLNMLALQGSRHPQTKLQRHNSMEQILICKQVQMSEPAVESQNPGHQNYDSQPDSNQQQEKSGQGLHYRIMGEKRQSQPPLGGEEQPQAHDQLLMMIRNAVDPQSKRNSVQMMSKATAPNLHIPQKGQNYLRMPPYEDPSKPANELDMSEDQQIMKRESTLSVSTAEREPQIPAHVDWIKKAVEVSHQKLIESAYLNRLQSEDKSSPKQNQKIYLAMGSPQINIGALSDPERQTNFEGSSPKKPDMSDMNVKRARLLMEKKKKQFEKWQEHADQNQTYQSLSLEQQQLQNPGQLSMVSQNQEPYRLGHQRQSIMHGGGNLVCVSGITYKSILPQQPQSSKPQNAQQMKSLADHPLTNKQLLNGYQKNFSVQQNRPGYHKRQSSDRIQAQGIQGKNISITSQFRGNQNQGPTFKQTGQQASGQGVQQLGNFDYQIDAEDLKALQLICHHLNLGNLNFTSRQNRKNVLRALQAAETGQALSSEPQSSNSSNQKNSKFFKFGNPTGSTLNGSKVVNNLIVFNHNGQTYIRNNETSFMDAGAVQLEQIEVGEKDLLETQRSLNRPTETKDFNLPPAPSSNFQQQSQAAYMADQMVQLGIGSRSLSKMLQEAQLEAALQHLAKNGALFNLLNLADLQGLETVQSIQQMTLLPPQQSPRSLRFRFRNDKQITKKQVSPVKNLMKPGESNGSLSTKPATSTTLNSTTRKGDAEEGKLNLSGKKGRQPKKEVQKQRVHIFHELDDSILKNHKINKAIHQINNIIRLIFKNNKDSTAITCTSNSNSLSAPSGNRLIEDTRVNELQKIAKQINIQIPKRFESKQTLREFFHSREFILNLKIRMQNLLHKAILTANGMPQSIIEANMCGNGTVGSGQPGKEENKIYQAKKFWVGPGNNFPIVKSVLKQRYWWQYGSEESFAADCDFIWTSWKKQKHIDFLNNVKKKHLAKLSQAQQHQHQQPAEGSETRSTINETEQKITRSNSEKRATKKKKDKHNSEQKEPTFTQAQIDKISLPLRLYNKLEQNKQLTNKKGVFVNMRKYYESLGQDPFKVLPLTFHTQHGVNDPEFHKFTNYFNALEQRVKKAEMQTKAAIRQYYADKKNGNKKAKDNDDDYDDEVDTDDEEAIQKIKRKYRSPLNTWIIKPGENTNRGQGITVVKTLRDVQQIVGRPARKDGDRTYIIQKYIDYPLLVHKRKFDFRCYGLFTSFNGSTKGYCYQDGYVRTSCREFTLDDISDPFIHLTNDAIQSKSEDYGKFENGNKMSLQDFSKVICAQFPELDFDFHRDIFPQIQKLIGDTYKAAFHKIDPQRLQNCFELFGYDFMIDEDFRLYLIEVNTNPCLEVCCPLLARIIPEVLDNCFKIVLDPLFPSPDLSHNRKFQLNELPQEVKFLLVFDEDLEGEQIRANFLRGVKGSIREAVGEEDIESDKENELAEDDGDDNNDAY